MCNKRILTTLFYTILVIMMLHIIISLSGVINENFDSNMSVDNKSLYESLTKECHIDYCNNTNWMPSDYDRKKIPDDYILSQYTVDKGCCIIPRKLNEYINIQKGNNNMN